MAITKKDIKRNTDSRGDFKEDLKRIEEEADAAATSKNRAWPVGKNEEPTRAGMNWWC